MESLMNALNQVNGIIGMVAEVVSVRSRRHPFQGWRLPSPPQIVQGRRLMLGNIQSTPVTRVSFLPGPEPLSRATSPGSREYAADEQLQRLPEPWSVRSLFGGNRH